MKIKKKGEKFEFDKVTNNCQEACMHILQYIYLALLVKLDEAVASYIIDPWETRKLRKWKNDRKIIAAAARTKIIIN